MLITYHGHSEFLIETAAGQRILTDPFDPKVPFPQKEVRAGLVTVSHGHFDHCYMDKVKGKPLVIRAPGEAEPLPGVKVSGYASFHDDAGGAKRGLNTIHIIQAEGLRVAHLGDLGAVPDEAVMAALQGVDILLVPVGGTYTLDAVAAAALVKVLRPRVVIPMHFRHGDRGFQAIAPAEDFILAMAPLTPSRQPLLRITAEDISEAPPLVVLEPV